MFKYKDGTEAQYGDVIRWMVWDNDDSGINWEQIPSNLFNSLLNFSKQVENGKL